MTTLNVGTGQQYTTIAAAVAASSSGDTVAVQAGTYTNDFVTISHNLTLDAAGGTVKMVATQQPPNGKAIIDEGGSGVAVTINGFDISGATVPDGNGAAIRYEGGSLTLNNDTIHGNQDGLLSAADPNGTITINGSNFYGNGTGTGGTHNIYVGAVGSLTVQNSTITGANVGHDIKSRAANTTITGNTITDANGGTASYEIDLPNGGNATITGNVIAKGANASNPIAIAFGEEGSVYAGSSLTVQGNTMVNDYTVHHAIAVWNATNASATFTGNSLYGWSDVSSGTVAVSGNTVLASEPALGSLTAGSSTGTSVTAIASGTSPTGTAATDNAGTTASADAVGSTASADSAPVTPATLGDTSPATFVSGTSAVNQSGTEAPAAQASGSPNLASALADAGTRFGAGNVVQAGTPQTSTGAYSGSDRAAQAASTAGAVFDHTSYDAGHHWVSVRS